MNKCIDAWPCFAWLLIGEVLILAGVLVVLTYLIEWRQR